MVRLTKIYTRGGDQGETHLGDGSRTAKDDPRITAIGAVDAANCTIGVAIASTTGGDWTSLLDKLTRIQNDLFDLLGCFPNHP